MFASRPSRGEAEPINLPGKIVVSLFGLVFAGAGLFLFAVVAKMVYAEWQTWTWQKTSCAMVHSGVGEAPDANGRGGDYEVEVEYRYTLAGTSFTSHEVGRTPKTYQDYGEATRLAAQFAAGTTAICYVNTAKPAEAVLVRSNLLITLLLGFPLIFVGVGGWTIYSAWRRKPAPGNETKPISDPAAAGRGPWYLTAFFGLFLGMGLLAGYSLLVLPGYRLWLARSWPAVPCVILSSAVQASSGSHGDTYRINILYTYESNGRTFQANAYGVMGGSSSGVEGKRAIVASYPPGRRTVCYVNPADPTDALLNRGLPAEMWFALIPAAFIVIGIAGVTHALRSRRARTPEAGVAATLGAIRPGSLILKPKTSPWANALGAVFICLFWNGITSVFVTIAVKSWRTGSPEWGLTIFMIPFVAFGLIMVALAFNFSLALFNPRPKLILTPGAVRLGETLQVQWEFPRRAERVKSLRLRLVGREEATYTRGSSSATDQCRFAGLELVNTTLERAIQSGDVRVVVPPGLAPTFAGKYNKISWTIDLRGEIAWWPDVVGEFPVTILPPARRNL